MSEAEPTNKAQEKAPVKPRFDLQVRNLVINRPRTITLADLAHEADVSQSWLDTFIAGKIANPGVRQIVTLYNFLSPEPLDF